MAKRRIFYDPSPKQEIFHQDVTSPELLLLGGKGSGKTYSLTQKGLQLSDLNFGVDGGLLCPTLKMFKRDVLPTIKNICRENKIPYKFNKSDSVFEFPLTRNNLYVFHSEDDGESIAGPNLGWGLINEVTLCSYLAYAEFISRIRDKRSKFPQVAMSGTPEDLEWIDEVLLSKKRLRFLQISTRENKHIAEWYVKALEDTYDSQRQKAYIDGETVSFNGRPAAWSFTQELVDDTVKYDTSKILEVWVTVDFNVSPMAGTIYLAMPHDHELILYGVAEIHIKDNARTYDFCGKVDAMCLELGLSGKNVYVYPDPAGKARQTRSSMSDINIIDSYEYEHINFGGCRYKKSITSIKDCLNAMNNMFDKRAIKYHSRCVETIKDMKKVKLCEDKFELDKADSKRTHWLDGTKNMCEYEYPCEGPTLEATIT